MADTEERTLPEVPLKWSEFVWSLEKLRHKPYSKRMRESDWFRINPLEMILLGCQTLSTNKKASRDHGTMILSMEDLSSKMAHHPRYWKRLITVLSKTIEREDTPGLIIQRCSTAIVQIWTGIKKYIELQPGFCVWCLKNMNLSNLVDILLSEKAKHLSPVTSQDLLDIAMEIQTIQSDSSILNTTLSTSTSISSDSTVVIRQAFRIISQIGEQNTTEKDSMESTLLLYLAIVEEGKQFENMCLSVALASIVKEAVLSLKRNAMFEENVALVFDIVILLIARGREFEETEEKKKEEEISDEDEDEDLQFSLKTLSIELFTKLLAFFKQWSEEIKTDPNVVTKLLEMVHTCLSSQPLIKSLPIIVEFFTSYIETLMAYSSEGYLSDNATAFFLQLLEFVSSLSEQGIPPIQAIQNNLPNLFGPFFGVHNHSVSCALLEYGYLSACSQHKKALLGEGLEHLVNVWRLFPALDKKLIQERASRVHTITLDICEGILNEILLSLPITEEASSSLEVSPDDHVTDENEVTDKSADNHVHNEGDMQSTTGSHDKELEIVTKETLQEEEDDLTWELSDDERQRDKDGRVLVLLRLLELACTMIRNGDNITFLYASILPRLFSSTPPPQLEMFNREKLRKFFGEEPPPPASNIPWRVDKKPLALQLLTLCVLSLENDMASSFQLCAIVVPKLVQNLDSMAFSDEEKLSLTMDILNITQVTLESGHNIEELVSHGLELLPILLPVTSSPEELKEFIQQIVHQLITSGQTSLLFLIRNACLYMKNKFPEELDGIQKLFRTMVFKGRRNEIRGLFNVCRDPFNNDIYSSLRSHLYGISDGRVSSRQLQAICELIVSAMDLQKSNLTKREVSTFEEDDLPEEENEEKKRRLEIEIAVLTKLVEPTLKTADEALKENRFKKEVWEGIQSQISRIALFRTLFIDELIQYHDRSSEELQSIFESKFPENVLCDEHIMYLLSQCATRIEHMQVPRYELLKKLLSQLLKFYLTADEKSERGQIISLNEREKYLIHHISEFTRNSKDTITFIDKCGYSIKLWDEEFSMTIKTDGSHSLEENMRQTLLACYTEFADILKQMGVTHVSVDGEMVKSVDLFDEGLTLTELKGRRAVAIRAIDQRLGGMMEGHFHEKKVALLSKEDEIEADFEQQAKAPVKPKTFIVKINTTFFDCAKCCGSQIIGCYAPTGEHCERPLEIGLRTDSGFISIYDEAGKEMENIEILLCEEGLYIFKAYTNGHPYDTSQVWVQVFTRMLQDPEPLVPAIIVPKSFPNQRTWDLLRRSVQPELTGSILTCQHDFSPEWRTYYDHRPEKVRCGVDMILHPGFSTTGPTHKPVFMRQRSRVTKDLAGLIFDDAIQKLLEDEDLKQFRFLGKYLSQYVSVLVEEGEGKVDIVSQGFDYVKWKRTQERNKVNTTSILPSKEEIVSHLISFIEDRVREWCVHADIKRLCEENHKQLLQMKVFLSKRKDQKLKQKYQELTHILTQCIYLVPISALSRAVQEEVIHWIFNNEDRVWRYRGGRDGHETLQQFMLFIGDAQGGKPVYPGVAAFAVPASLSDSFQVDISRDFGVSNLIGYAVGEVMIPSLQERQDEDEDEEGVVIRWRPNKMNCYEVVTSWIHPKYQKLNLSIQMYFDVAQQAPTRLVMCDMIVGSVERIIHSNPLLRFLQWIRILQYVVWKRQQSYSVQMQTGSTEQFEQVVFLVWPMRLSLWLHTLYVRIMSWCGYSFRPQPYRIK